MTAVRHTLRLGPPCQRAASMGPRLNASENAGEVITDLTLEMNRARQAEITQEIMEVVAGAESLT